MDLKCNRIYKLPVSSSCLGTFLWSLFFLNYQFLHYLFFMSSYGHIVYVIILGFCVSGSTAATHWRSPRVRVLLEVIFSFINFLNAHCIVVTNTGCLDINRLMGYRDAQWYIIKNIWIDFSATYIVK